MSRFRAVAGHPPGHAGRRVAVPGVKLEVTAGHLEKPVTNAPATPRLGAPPANRGGPLLRAGPGPFSRSGPPRDAYAIG
ncbi:hypothetical protein ACIRUL_15410 [Streptomyces sp. NPDC101171]|uniref:hypothetical protein n=1 Tax=Streptomyces sp. NPDC101171 TaxID=3366122 RepID=UPI0037FC902B